MVLFHLKTFFHLNVNLGILKFFRDSKFEEYDSFLALGIFFPDTEVDFYLVWENHSSFALLAEVHIAHFGVDVHRMMVLVTLRPREHSLKALVGSLIVHL